MDKVIHSTNNVHSFLSANVERFAGFANQVIRDEQFLNCARSLLPFDGVAHASMNVIPGNRGLQKLGMMIMRMDLDPSLFGLAITLAMGDSQKERPQGVSVFLTACRTISELQAYVNTNEFREEVMVQCSSRISVGSSILAKDCILRKRRKE